MNIFVAKLSDQTTSEDLNQLFSEYGEVTSAKVIMDRETGQSKRFGFVEMPQEDAARAIQSLNGYSMGGRPLRVNEAQDRPRTGGGGGRPGGR